ncbi:MAG: mechanosensitive ion channel [Paludibacteraceae bacterium]|nr:mechanosensitive ion channel [Paludibacteraceae bacterium]
MLSYFPQIAGTAISIIVAGALRVGLKLLINKYLRTHPHPDIKISHVSRLVNLFINTLALIAILIIWGVDTKNVFVALGSVFAVIGVALFAQWSILSNITAGIILFFSAPFRIGDYIRILDKDMPIEATVEDIYTFYTHLRTKDGGLHIFPNSLLLQKAISVINKENDNELSEDTID